MKVRKTFVIEELPWSVRLALLRFADSHTDGEGYFAIDTVTIVGKRLPHEKHEHPHDDATGFADDGCCPESAGAIV